MIDSVSEGDVGGVGLAAPQIGVLKRVIVVNLEEKFDCFINPEIEVLDREPVIEEEGCLSLYSIRTPVSRPKKIRLTAKNLKGETVTVNAEDMVARIFLHEMDHLNGILFIDHLKPEDRKNFLSKLNKDILL
jgi:peptide deformylase